MQSCCCFSEPLQAHKAVCAFVTLMWSQCITFFPLKYTRCIFPSFSVVILFYFLITWTYCFCLPIVLLTKTSVFFFFFSDVLTPFLSIKSNCYPWWLIPAFLSFSEFLLVILEFMGKPQLEFMANLTVSISAMRNAEKVKKRLKLQEETPSIQTHGASKNNN